MCIAPVIQITTFDVLFKLWAEDLKSEMSEIRIDNYFDFCIKI